MIASVIRRGFGAAARLVTRGFGAVVTDPIIAHPTQVTLDTTNRTTAGVN